MHHQHGPVLDLQKVKDMQLQVASTLNHLVVSASASLCSHA